MKYYISTPMHEPNWITEEQYSVILKASPMYFQRIAEANKVEGDDARAEALRRAEELTDFSNGLLRGCIVSDEVAEEMMTKKKV